MATGMNHELDTLHNCKSAITDGVANQANPGWLSRKLQEKEMISAETASAIVNNASPSNEDKVDRLLQAVESKLRRGPNPAQIFQEFIKILQSEPALQDLAQKLQTEYTKCHTTSSTDCDSDLPSDTAAEESSLLLMEEGRIGLHGQTQVEQGWRSNRARIIRCLPQRCDNQCIKLTFCGTAGVLVAVMVLILIIRISGEINLRLKRDTDQEIAVPYGISRKFKLFIKQEVLLWLSCFIICTPWILAQYMCQTTRRKLAVVTCCCLLMVGVLYFLKDFECFQIRGIFLSALFSLTVLSPVACQLPRLRHFYEHFCLRLLITLLWLTVVMVYISFILSGLISLIAAVKPDIQQEVQENELQGLQSLPTIPGVFIQQEVQENKLQGLQSLPTVPGVLNNVRQHIKQQQSVYIRGAIDFIIGCLLGLIFFFVLPVILIICADRALPIYQDRTMYRSTLCLSILGVVTTFALFSALLLTVIDSLEYLLFSILGVLFLLQANLVLLMATASIKRLPSNFKWFKNLAVYSVNLVVYFGIIIGVRNLLLEALLLWKTW